MTTEQKEEELELVKWPAKILRTPTEICKERPDIYTIQLMGKLMVKSGGIGLAANQAGFGDRFFIANFDGQFTVCINPEIIRHGKEEIESPEGCLSVVDDQGKIIWKNRKRYAIVTLRYHSMDTFYSGQPVERVFKRFHAKIVQHEMDHLEGLLCHTTRL